MKVGFALRGGRAARTLTHKFGPSEMNPRPPRSVMPTGIPAIRRCLSEATPPISPPVLTAGVVIGQKRAEEIFEQAYDDHAHRLAKLYENVGKAPA